MIITVAAAVLLAAANWRMGPASPVVKHGASPALTLADQHPIH